MTREADRAWAQEEGLRCSQPRPLRFDTPLLRWTLQHEIDENERLVQSSRQDDAWREEGVKLAIARVALGAMRYRRLDIEIARRCLRHLRRAWWAHCASAPVRRRIEFDAARAAWLKLSDLSRRRFFMDAVRARVAQKVRASKPRRRLAVPADEQRAEPVTDQRIAEVLARLGTGRGTKKRAALELGIAESTLRERLKKMRR